MRDVAPLVAHHSGARFEAAARNCIIPSAWAMPDRRLLGVLTYFDHTTDRVGEPVTDTERRLDLVTRYGAGSLKVLTFDLARSDAELGFEIVEGVRV